jgi:Flp pilus assembly protein protease CpaA
VVSLSHPNHPNATSVSPALIPAVILIVILWLSVLSDVRTRKIPNALILGGVALAAIWQAFGPSGAWAFDPDAPGGVGIAFGALAFLATLAVHFPLFAFGVMGAGDVKLIAVVAGVVGASPDAWSHLVGLSLSIFVAGGVLAVAWWLAPRVALVKGPTTSAVRLTDGLPYSIAIAIGTAAYAIGKSMGLITLL